MPSMMSGSSASASGARDLPISLRMLISVGTIPSSSQSGLLTFMGVSMKIDGLSVVNENSRLTVDQSVMMVSDSRMELLDEKSFSK